MTPDLSRPRATPPYDILPAVPSFSLTSEDLADGERMGDRFTAIHENLSPGLRWSGAPAGTRSFVVSCFDPDAPSPSGWWHWTVVDLPASAAGLPRGAGESDDGLAAPAFHVRNDAGTRAWFGPYPPAGDGDNFMESPARRQIIFQCGTSPAPGGTRPPHRSRPQKSGGAVPRMCRPRPVPPAAGRLRRSTGRRPRPGR